MYTQGYQPQTIYTMGDVTCVRFIVNGRTFISQTFTNNDVNYRSCENSVKQKHPEAIITKADLPDI